MSQRSVSFRLSLPVLACVVALTACGGAEKQDEAAAPPAASESTPSAASAGTGQEIAPSSQTPQLSQIEQLLQMLDADGDGRISRDEHLSRVHRMFDRMDSDRDGYVSVEEMDVVRGELHGEGRTPSQTELSKVDSDGDNKLSQEEHSKSTRVEFERMDRDHDGYLTVSELETAQSGH